MITTVFKQPYKGKPIKVIFREGKIAEYSYLFFNKPITDNIRTKWENTDSFKVYNDSIVFEYDYH